jgi:4-aminobutyrate aminotransferase/4-aminobutyrate aminotransferase/(S)-3-amino-2-methylpropionate transaminase
MIVGKGMGGGYPVTGVISTSAIMSASPYADPSASSSSYGAFPLACRAVDATLNVILEEDLVEHSACLGTALLQQLKSETGDVAVVGDVRGRGLMIGIELVEDDDKRRASKETVREIYLAILRAGVLVMTGGNSLRLYPPLSIQDEIAHEAVSTIARVLREQSSSRM